MSSSISQWKFLNPFCINFSFFLSQTVDVFAIVALSGILSRLLSTGTVLVATSNRAPEDLNQVGNFPQDKMEYSIVYLLLIIPVHFKGFILFYFIYFFSIS